MRFVLLTALLLAVPAGCLVVAGRQAASLEDALFQDASGQVKQFDDLVRMYPPSLRRMKNSAEYLRLQRVGEPAEMAAIVCRAPEGPYSQILDRLPGRCAEWQRLRRARARGMLGAAGAVLTLILLLLVRIGLRWRPAGDQAAQATRLVMVGIQALLAVEAAGGDGFPQAGGCPDTPAAAGNAQAATHCNPACVTAQSPHFGYPQP